MDTGDLFSEYSDPRDIVYALLGLAGSSFGHTEYGPSHPAKLQENIVWYAPLSGKAIGSPCSKSCMCCKWLRSRDWPGWVYRENGFCLALGTVCERAQSICCVWNTKALVRIILSLVNLPSSILTWYLNFCTTESSIKLPLGGEERKGLVGYYSSHKANVAGT